VLYGPAGRARLRPETRRVLFALDAPPGIAAPAITRHLEDLRAAVRLFSPDAVVEALEVYGA
jgi:NADPH-dependent ferric siderophore reductase